MEEWREKLGAALRDVALCYKASTGAAMTEDRMLDEVSYFMKFIDYRTVTLDIDHGEQIDPDIGYQTMIGGKDT